MGSLGEIISTDEIQQGPSGHQISAIFFRIRRGERGEYKHRAQLISNNCARAVVLGMRSVTVWNPKSP